MAPEGVCYLGGDIGVSDGNGKRIVATCWEKWGEVILSDIGKSTSNIPQFKSRREKLYFPV